MSGYVVHARDVDGPATHAIVIGVGRYPHLLGGDGPLADRHDNLGQLTSPAVSARAVARWMIRSLNSPKPLGHVLLLTSEEAPAPFRNPVSGEELPVAEATIDHIEAALTEWRAFGERSEDERLIFYFCGHGMGRGNDVTLLAADYGVKPGNPLDGAIDFGYFRSAMDECAAREQLYFVDACRASSGSLLRAGQYNGRPIFQQGMGDVARSEARRAPVYYSSLPGTDAYGRENSASAFTEALIDALAGAGSDDNDGPWLVTTGRLKEALDFFVTRAAPRGRVQVPAADDHGRIVVHAPRGKPKGTAVVVCEPYEATEKAAFKCLSRARVRAERAPAAGEWVVTLPLGRYEFVAEFPAGEYRRQRTEAEVRPVYKRIGLPARR